MPNSFAYLMLMLWPLVCWGLFRSLSMERAIIWTILGGYLILPQSTGLDLPLVPDMTKVTIPNICAFAFCVFYLKKPVALWPRGWGMRLLIIGFVLGVIATVLTNRDAIIFTFFGTAVPVVPSGPALPGLGLRDLLSVVINQILILLPFLLARQFLSTTKGLRDLLLALMVGGLIYSIPALVEIAISPQLHTWVYGFFQHDFQQMIRDGGFRPIVFLPHALWISFFFLSAAMAAIALSRKALRRDRLRWLACALWLMVVLVLCKSLAVMLYAMLLGPVLLLTNPRLQIRLALIFALIAVIYPMLRNHGLIPLDDVLRRVEAFNPERAQSLGYRFANETILLERAHEKSLFGWGGWGRNLVHDTVTGEIISIPDGEWIIVFGTFGWVGYISVMGLLGAPLFLLWWQIESGRRTDSTPLLGPIALLLAITMIDMLINAILTPYTWLLAGAVLGHCENTARGAIQSEEDHRWRPVMGQVPVTGPRTRL